jgi:hypothetical protein
MVNVRYSPVVGGPSKTIKRVNGKELSEKQHKILAI